MIVCNYFMRRTNTWIVSFSIISLVYLATAHAQGASDRGGGGSEHSNEGTVKAATTSEILGYLGWAAKNSRNSRIRAISAKVHSMIEAKPLASGEFEHSLIEGRDYQFTNEDCKDQYGHSVTASAVIGSSEPICLSMSRLMMIPPVALQEQLRPLLAHELAHQAGYGEDDAAYLQNQLLKVYKNSDGKLQLRIMLEFLDRSIRGAQKLISLKSAKSRLCAIVGEVAGFTHSAARMGFVFAPSGVAQDLEDDMWDLNVLVGSLDTIDYRTFCGLRPTWTEMPEKQHEVARGDLNDLRSSLRKTSSQVHSILKSMP
jgi:hypothetical protein